MDEAVDVDTLIDGVIELLKAPVKTDFLSPIN